MSRVKTYLTVVRVTVVYTVLNRSSKHYRKGIRVLYIECLLRRLPY